MINFLLALTLHFNFCNEVYKEITGKDPREENVLVCSLLIEDAKKQELDVNVTLATAWEESRFTQQFRPTKYDCMGPLQIKYKYWCPNKKGRISPVKDDGELHMCDPYHHGVRALKYYIDKFKPLEKALCYYNNSAKCRKSNMSVYVKRVFEHKTKIDAVSNKKEYSNL